MSVILTGYQASLVDVKGDSRHITVRGFDGEIGRLLELSDAPQRIFYTGNLKILEKRSVSIVGTRNLTDYGRASVKELLSLPGLPLNYVSGLARGIDAEVHKIALDNNIDTVAIVAGALNQGYPRSNQQLYNQIASKGLIIAEFPQNKPFFKGMYPMRNRLIAALSPLTIVIEAGLKSGALITARYALELGLEVAAVPGSIFAESCKGSNKLISEGAHAINSCDDLITLINRVYGLSYTYNSMTGDYHKLDFLKNLPDTIKYIDGFDVKMAASISKMTVDKILPALTSLEMDGILQRNFSGKYILKK